MNQQLPPIILVTAWNLQHLLQQQARAFGSFPGCCFALSTASGLKPATIGAGAWLLGGPNSNDFAANHIIHHSVGLPDLKQQYRCD
jgi:hypothetical protein